MKETRRIIEKWRAELPYLVQPEQWMPLMVALLDDYDTIAKQKNELKKLLFLCDRTCETVHHAKKDLHDSGPCPVVTRITTALEN